MKKITVIVALLFIASTGFTQVTGGGVNKQQQTSSSDIEGFSYFMLTMLSPTGDYGASTNSLNSNAMGAKTGLMIQGGKYRYGIELPVDNLELGLYTSYGIGFNNFDWGIDATQIPFIISEIKLGPVLTYAVNQDFAIDGFFKFGPMFTFGGAIDTDDNDVWDMYNTKPGIGLKVGFGANIRYSSLILGIAFNPAELEMEYDTDESDPFNIYPIETDVPFSTFRLSVGVNF
jgi:hypothetical protein